MSNKAYEFQNKMVVYHLIHTYNYSIEDATKLWYKSKTKHIIQNEISGEHVSPLRCLTELLMEINNDPMWNTDIYD